MFIAIPSSFPPRWNEPLQSEPLKCNVRIAFNKMKRKTEFTTSSEGPVNFFTGLPIAQQLK
jgi:hypothetical protein